ncbi:MAG: DUF4836 family protein [Bacteroidota bacterium]
MKNHLKSYETMKLPFPLLGSVLMVLLVFQISILKAQSLSDYIPREVRMVVSLDMGNFQKKANLNEFKDLSMYQSGMEMLKKSAGPMGQTLQEVIEHPSDYGMDFLSPAMVYLHQEDGVNYTTMLISLSSAAKFQQLLEALSGGFLPIEDKGSFKMMSLGSDNALAWNDDLVQMVNGKRDTTSISEFPAPLDVSGRLTKLMNKDFKASIDGNPFYKRAVADPADLMVWVDRAMVKQWQMDQRQDADMDTKWLEEMFGGAYDTDVRMGLHFNNGNIRLDADYLGEPSKIQNLNKFYRQDKWNKQFGKYMPGKELLGLFAMNINTVQMITIYQSVMKGFMGSLPDSLQSSDVNEFLQSGKIEDFIGMFAGDMIMGVTGMYEYEKVVTEMEYDENFEEKEVQKTVKDRFPKMLGLISCKDVAKVQAFLDQISSDGMLEKRGKLYQMGAGEGKFTFYMAVHKGMLFLSNDLEAMNEGQPKKYSRKKRMTKQQCKMLNERVMLVQADVAAIMTAMNGGEQAADNSGGGGNFNVGKQSVESFVMEMKKQVDPTKMRMSMMLNFSAKEKNALFEVMGLAEAFLPMLLLSM